MCHAYLDELVTWWLRHPLSDLDPDLMRTAWRLSRQHPEEGILAWVEGDPVEIVFG